MKFYPSHANPYLKSKMTSADVSTKGRPYRIDCKTVEATSTHVRAMSRGTPGLKQKCGWGQNGRKPVVKVCGHHIFKPIDVSTLVPTLRVANLEKSVNTCTSLETEEGKADL